MREAVKRLPLFDTPHGDQTRGEWYVSRASRGPSDWDSDEQSEYLHADGVWRGSTYSGDVATEQPTGYFATEDDAKAALAKVRGEQPT